MNKMISNCVKCGKRNSYCISNMLTIDERIAAFIYSALNVAKA